jgi:PAS domain S-box-containing protein
MSFAKMSDQGQPHSDAEANLAVTSSPDGSRKRVLLIEDEHATRLVLLTKLRMAGFDVDVAPNGSVALDKLRRGHPDAIFMDLLLSDLKGVDVIKEARRDPKFGSRPIYVCISADRMSAWTRRGTKAGATKVFDRASTPVDAIVAEVAAELIGSSSSTDSPAAMSAVKADSEALQEIPAQCGTNVVGSGRPAESMPQSKGNNLPGSKSSILPFNFMKRVFQTFGLARTERPDPVVAPAEAPIPEAPDPTMSKPATAAENQIVPSSVSSPLKPEDMLGQVPDSECGGMTAMPSGRGVAVLTLDAVGQILSAGNACTAVFGWEGRELVGQNVLVLLKDGLDNELGRFLQQKSGGGSNEKSSFRVVARKKDGTEFAASVTPLTWSSDTTLTQRSDNSRLCWTAVFRDLACFAASPSQSAKALHQENDVPPGQPLAQSLSTLQEPALLLHNASEEVQKQFQTLSAEAATHLGALAQSGKEREQLAGLIYSHELELHRVQTALERAVEERKQLEQKLQDLTTSKASLENQLAEQSQNKEELLKSSAQIREQLDEAKAVAERAEAALKQEGARANRLEEELAKLRLTYGELNDKLRAEQQAAAESMRRGKELESRLHANAEDLELVKTDADQHTEQQGNLETALRAQLDAAKAATERAEAGLKEEAARNKSFEERLRTLCDNLRREQTERTKRFGNEVAGLRQVGDELRGKLSAEQQAAAESARRAEELEGRLRDSAAEVDRVNSELAQQTTEQARLEVEWREQLNIQETLTKKLEAALLEAEERSKRFEEELSTLRQVRDELNGKLTIAHDAASQSKVRVEELESRLRDNAAELERANEELKTSGRNKGFETELFALQQVRDALSLKLTAEQRANSEFRQRTEDLEKRLRENDGASERVKADAEKHAEEQAHLGSELETQLSLAKAAAERAEAALQEKSTQCSQFENELATLRQVRDELDGKLTTEQRAAVDSRQRNEELQSRLSENTAELECVKANADKHAEEQARQESELRAQLNAAKAAAEQAEAALKEEAARHVGFEERLRISANTLRREEAARAEHFKSELAKLQQARDELSGNLAAEQKAVAESRRHSAELENRLRENASELERIKAQMAAHAEERGRVESGLHAQLNTTQAAAKQAKEALAEKAAQCTQFDAEMARLRQELTDLNHKFTAQQQTVAGAKQHTEEVENRLLESAGELERVKADLRKNVEQRGSLELELRAQLNTERAAAKQAKDAFKEKAVQCSRFDAEVANLRLERNELNNKFIAEQQAAAESRQHAEELENRLRESIGELERFKADLSKHGEERGSMESELREQLSAAKAAAKQAKEALKAKTAQLNQSEQEVTKFRQKSEELHGNFVTEQNAAETAKRRIKELEKQLRETATSFASFKAELENRASERGGLESELRKEVEAAKTAAQQADASRREEVARSNRLEEELAGLRQLGDELTNNVTTGQQVAAESAQRIEKLENRLRETAAELARAKVALENQTAEWTRSESNDGNPTDNTKRFGEELCRLRENAAAHGAEISELEQRVRESVASLARVTVDLEKERGERRRVEQRSASLTAQLQQLHGELKQHLESQRGTQDRVGDLEQQLRDSEGLVARVSADWQKETTDRQLAEEQLRAVGDMSAQLRKYLSLFEESKKVFKRTQDAQESRLKASLDALSEKETKLQQEASERQRLEKALAVAQQSVQDQSERSALDLVKLQSELQVEQFERKRLEGDALQSRYASLDSTRVGRTMVNSFRRQVRQPVEDLMQSTRRLLAIELGDEQKKLVESVLEHALLLQTSLQEAGASNGGSTPARGNGQPELDGGGLPDRVSDKPAGDLQP